MILNGKIDDAINKCDEINKDILDKNCDIHFNLKLQKLIEFIKEDKIDESIKFAQEELLPLV